MARLDFKGRFASVGGLAAACLLSVLALPAAESAEIAVSCGATTNVTNITTSRELRKLKAVRIVVDPNNNCHVEVALELVPPPVRAHVTPSAATAATASESGAASRARCFSFAGRRYCE